jgi:uncharacterized protein (TIGR03032 family)
VKGTSAATEREELWEVHGSAWRDPPQVASLWEGAGETDPRLLRSRAGGDWWELLERLGITLLVTREYEHLAMGLTAADGRPHATYAPLPHPSGVAVDAERHLVHVASTRNPNQVFDLAPATGSLERGDAPPLEIGDRPLVPLRSRFYPGSLYLHELAMVGSRLHGNAVGQNAVVALPDDGGAERAWWPRSIDEHGEDGFAQNYLQLNSIAAGEDLESSYFTASAAAPSARRPGHRNFAVDRRGVVLSGASREPVAGGLTRPHSARLHRGELWVDDSGYGRVGRIVDGRLEEAARLPGWTRGLCFHGDVAFVGTSRVIPRFRSYAPGLDVDRSACGVHALDTRSGEILGSLTWPYGNQVFAVEWMPRVFSLGLPARVGARGNRVRLSRLSYSFAAGPRGRGGDDHGH